MSFADYHFVTHWRVRGPIQTVYAILKDGAGYSRWWKPAYLQTEIVGPQFVRSLVRAKFPYTLDFKTELVRENPPRELELRASGDLTGRGLWKLRQEGDITAVDFYWDVRAEKMVVKLLSPFLRFFFQWNHDWVMRVGEKGLRKELTRNNPVQGG